MDTSTTLLSDLLPTGVLDYFEISSLAQDSKTVTIRLTEKNIIPEHNKSGKLISKGFYEAVKVQDFPIRDKACFLEVKRRRWLEVDTGEYVARDWDLVAKGTRMTAELASFLKGINRYSAGFMFKN